MKNLIIIALMLFIVPMASASSEKIFEMGDRYQSVIHTESIQDFEISDNTIYIKFSYFSTYKNFYYKDSTQAQQKYRELVQEMKQHAVNECLRYGGGKACYMR